MRRVGEFAPRVVLEAVPLLREVLDVVVADVAKARMHGGNLGDVRGVDDDLATVGTHRLELVEALRARPDVLVHLRHNRDDPLVRFFDVADVRVSRNLRARGPGALGAAEAHRVEVTARRAHDHREAVFGRLDACTCRVDELSHGRDAKRTDDAARRDERPHPVRDVDDVVHGAAGEEVLIAARESHDFVGEHGADDKVDVRFDDVAIDVHAHGNIRKQPARELGDRVGTDLAEVGDLLVVVPFVVADLERGVRVFKLSRLGAEHPLDALFAHRRVRAERNEHRDVRSAVLERVVNGGHHARKRHGAGAVGNDHAHALAVEIGCRELLGDKSRNLLVGERLVGAADASGGAHQRCGNGLHVINSFAHIAHYRADYNRLPWDIATTSTLIPPPARSHGSTQPQASRATCCLEPSSMRERTSSASNPCSMPSSPAP